MGAAIGFLDGSNGWLQSDPFGRVVVLLDISGRRRCLEGAPNVLVPSVGRFRLQI